MKQFINNCYKCKVKVRKTKTVMDGIKLNCLKCPKCGEEYFTSSELIRYDILKGNRGIIRKFGKLSNSLIIRIPDKLARKMKISSGDFAYFEKKPEGLLIKHIKKKDLEANL